MKRTTMTAALMVLTLLALPVVAEEVDPPAIAGRWMAPEQTYAIEIAPCEGSLCGTIVWAEDESLVGKVVLTELALSANGKGEHGDGELADPESGKTYYRCELGLDEDGRLQLEGQMGVMRHGRVVLSRFPTKFHFTRVEALPGN